MHEDVLLTEFDRLGDRVQGYQVGCDAYLAKPFEPEELVAQVESSLNQIRRWEQGRPKGLDGGPTIHVPHNVELTPTELKVVNLVAKGMANREIAKQLNVSQRTIESHVSNMLNKTSLNNRTELARWAIESSMA